MTLREIMINGASEMGITFSDAALTEFEKYYALLSETNKVMNLTAITGVEETAKLHFLDSVKMLDMLGNVSGKKVIDIGSGAGFPGFPMKITDNSINLTILDSLAKRINFLENVKAELYLENVECIHARAEEQALKDGFRDSFDFAVSRAVARLNLLVELCLPYVKPGGTFAAMKSTDTEEEITEAKNAVKRLGGEIKDVKDYVIPATDVKHRVVLIRKLSPTPKGYPRRFAKIQKSPL